MFARVRCHMGMPHVRLKEGKRRVCWMLSTKRDFFLIKILPYLVMPRVVCSMDCLFTASLPPLHLPNSPFHFLINSYHQDQSFLTCYINFCFHGNHLKLARELWVLLYWNPNKNEIVKMKTKIEFNITIRVQRRSMLNLVDYIIMHFNFTVQGILDNYFIIFDNRKIYTNQFNIILKV